MTKGVIATALVLVSTMALAASKADIKYPVSELGGCKDERSCRAYCEDSKHIRACVDFAERYQLMSSDEASRARRFADLGAKGPGGCDSDKSCKTYCDDISRIDECLSFGEKHGMMDPSELAEAKKVQAALKRGAKLPGGCTSKESCESYCNDGSRMEECVAFAETAGFMDEDELHEARAALAAVKKGAKLPKCRGRDACEEYCTDPDHLEECMVFAEAAGFVTHEEAAMIRKTGGRGPGGCRGRDQCEAFCERPENGEVCYRFAEEHDMLSKEDREQMEEGREQLKDALEDAPPGGRECVEAAIGREKLEAILSGKGMPSRDMGETVQNCFERAFRDSMHVDFDRQEDSERPESHRPPTLGEFLTGLLIQLVPGMK